MKSDSAVYFTDPPPRPPFTPVAHGPELDVAGVCRVSPDLRTINRVGPHLINPNGLCFSPDETILSVNNSNAHRKFIMAYDLISNGMVDLCSERLLCDIRADPRRGGPDGMKVDIEGNLYCTGPGGIWILASDGRRLGTSLTDDRMAINLAWGDANWSTLYSRSVAACIAFA